MLIIIFACLLLAAVGPCDATSCSATTALWEQIEGALVKVSVGPAGVWGVNVNNQIWYRDDTYGTATNLGGDWTQVDEPIFSLMDLDVGDDVVWGITLKGKLTCRKGINEATPQGETWKILKNKAKDVAISPNGQLVAINELGQFVYREGLSSKCSRMGKWFAHTDSSLNLTQISVGEAGIWAVAADSKIYYRPGSMGDTGYIGTEWEQVNGGLVSLGVGKDFVVGVSSNGQIWRREGMASSNSGGTGWIQLTGDLKVVDAYNGCYAWGVKRGQDIWLGTF
ncbi:perivitellin-2 31 kDa subunit-like [Littorina saxatilis]|uniref:Uncharacterized protein n=1 Tax=Littorina saxatilis TaxID=31220 RepID=A0AAN9BF65_9CAEN